MTPAPADTMVVGELPADRKPITAAPQRASSLQSPLGGVEAAAGYRHYHRHQTNSRDLPIRRKT
jgi:hypothetical protein